MAKTSANEKKINRNEKRSSRVRVEASLCGKNVKKENLLKEINTRILDNAPISIITIDKKGYITSANKYYFKFSRTKDYRGHNIFTSNFFIRENLIGDYRKLLADGTMVKKEGCYERNSEDKDKYMRIIAVPLRGIDGKIEGALSMAADDTENVLFRRKLEELNRNLEEKVSRRTAELNKANKDLAEVLTSKTTFMADVSHELRTSLAIIQGNMELMKECSDSAEESDQILNEIKRMSIMLEDLTLLANSDLSVQKLNYAKFNINRPISFVLKSLAVLAKEKNIKIEHKNSKAVIEVVADEGKLEKLIMNLARNAIRYNKNNGWIDIWAESGGNEVILKVEDSGIGIAKNHLPHIFDRFYCVDRDKSRKEGGSGLGLAICKWIADSHGGSISVRSKIGKGSLFTVRLPRNCKKPN